MAPDPGQPLAVGAEVHPLADHLGQLLAEPAQQRRRVQADVEAPFGGVGVLRRVHQEAVHLRAGLDGGQVGVEGRLHPAAAFRGGVERGPQGVEQGVGVPDGECLVEARLVPEVPVEDGLGDAGLGRDGVHGGLGAVPEYDPVGGFEQLPPAAFGRSRFARLLRGLHDVFSPRPCDVRDAHAT